MLKRINNVKLKVVSILLVITIMTVHLNSFMLNATPTQLQFYSLNYETPAEDSEGDVFYSNATLGGQTAYSIDYGKILPSGTLAYYKSLSVQGLSVLVNGYPNVSAYSMGCATKEEAYFATQMALWMSVSSTGESEGRFFNIEDIVAKAENEDFIQRVKTAAQNLYYVAVSNPYFLEPLLSLNTENAKISNENGITITGPYEVNVYGGNAINITASLVNAPESAKITDVYGNEVTNFNSGDHIYVRFNDYEEGSLMTLNVVADANKLVGSVYSSDSVSQSFVILDNVPVELNQSVNITWKTQTGNIEVLKLNDNNEGEANISFELKDLNGEIIDTGITNEEGYIVFNEIKAGSYILVDSNLNTSDVVVKANETVKVQVGGMTEKVNNEEKDMNLSEEETISETEEEKLEEVIIVKAPLKMLSMVRKKIVIIPDDVDEIELNRSIVEVAEVNSSSKVIVRYIDEYGNELVEKEIIEGKYGDKYYTLPKYIYGYELSRKEPVNKNGIMKAGVTEVIYEYSAVRNTSNVISSTNIIVDTSDMNIVLYGVIFAGAVLAITGIVIYITRSKKK